MSAPAPTPCLGTRPDNALAGGLNVRSEAVALTLDDIHNCTLGLVRKSGGKSATARETSAAIFRAIVHIVQRV